MGQRLIDAEEFEELFDKQIEYGATDIIAAVYDALQDTLTVDAVPVVRCSECMHWMHDVAGCTENVGRCEYANYFIGAAGYCVYGEREEGADNAK